MAFEHMAKIVFITSVMPASGFESEFEAVMGSLRLSASSPSPTAEPSPEVIPADWKTYVDPVLGFSLRYPPDLAVTDTGPTPSGGLRERDLDFRAPEDPSRALVIAMVENTKGRSLEQWVLEFAACLPEAIKQANLSGTPAIFCTSDAGEGPSGAAAFEHMGTMFLIRSTTPASEFEPVLASLRLSPEAIPADWKTYVDPVLGFSLRYPPDLVLTDLTGPTPAGSLQERVLLARAAQDQARVLSVSIIESNPKGLAIDEWAVEYAGCNPKSIQPGLLGRVPAILCTREAFEEWAEPAVAAEVGGRIFLITNGSGLTGDEFSAVVRSFQP
jgi:hypothetical protein